MCPEEIYRCRFEETLGVGWHGHTRASDDRCIVAASGCFFLGRWPLHRPAQRHIGPAEENLPVMLGDVKSLKRCQDVLAMFVQQTGECENEPADHWKRKR